MNQFKHLQCETHQDEKFIHYCQDCHYPLCPECLYPHTQLHKQKRQFPNIISLKGISQICLEKIKENSNFIQNDLEDVEQQIQYLNSSQISQFSINHAHSQQVLKQIKTQMISWIEEIFQQIHSQLSMNMKEIQGFTKSQISPFIKNLQSLEQLLEQSKIIITQYDPQMIETINSVLGFDNINNYGQIKNDLKIHIHNIKSKQIHLKYEDYIEKLNKFGVSVNTFFQISQEQNYQSFSDRKENIQLLDSIRSTKCKKPSLSNLETQTAKQKLFFSSLNQLEITAPNYFLGNKKYLHFFQNESNLLHLLDLESKNGFEIMEISNVSQFPSFHQSIATPDGILYLIGGSLENGKKSAITYKMDFNTNKIVPKGSLNEGRSSFGICFQNNYVYAIGGYGNGQLVMKSCERYKDGQWEYISNLNIGCANMSCCTFGNQYIFKFGGVKQTTEICHIIERYSIQGDEWEIIQPQLYNNLSRIQLTCLSASVQINQSDMMILGGYDEQNQGSYQTMILSDLGNGQYLLQEAEKKIVINEGFWNQNIVIEDNRLWMLQNIIDENEEDCIQSERNLLIFDGEWCKL